MPRRTLEGVLVVALEQAVAAPLATSRLADAGARVIKIERAEGDFARAYDRAAAGGSSYFAWLNRGKESLVLDIKAPEDRALLERLIARADVFVQNLAPGATARLGLGSEALRRVHPKLITCDVSSYGAEGPYADRKGYDLLLQAETGLASVTGAVSGPGRVGVSVCDIAAGLYAYQAILEALIARRRTGVGETLQVSLFDALADWMTVPLLQAEATGESPARLGLAHVSIAPYGAYACADGSEVLLAVQNPREWAALCTRVIGRPEMIGDARFADNSARVANRAALDAILRPTLARFTREALVTTLDAADIAFGAVNTVLDLAAHPHLRRVPVATATGSVSVAAPPAVRPGEAVTLGPVPEVGEHSAAIRLEFADEARQARPDRPAGRPITRDLFIDGRAGQLAVRIKLPETPRQAVVLVQGSNLSGQGMFDTSLDAGDDYSLLDVLADRGFAAVTFAIRGYGRSEAPADPFSVTTEVAMEDLDAVMTWVVGAGLSPRPHLFGFSWGGRIAGRWAEENAERLDRLVLYDPARGGGNLVLPAPADEDGWWVNTPSAYSEKMDARFTDPDLGRALSRYVVDHEPRSPNGIRRENARYVIPIQPARITRPTLLIYGAEAAKADYMKGGVERGDFFEQLATDDKAFVILPGGDDFLHWQAGRRLLHRRVVEFLT